MSSSRRHRDAGANRTPTASRRSSSSSHVGAPSFTAFSFGSQPGSDRLSLAPSSTTMGSPDFTPTSSGSGASASNTTLGTPQFTLSSTFLTFGRPATSATSGTSEFAPSSNPFMFRSSATSTTTGTPEFSPSSTIFTVSGKRESTSSFTSYRNVDANEPFPSIERDDSSTSSRQSTPSRGAYRPLASRRTGLSQQTLSQDDGLQQFGNMRISSQTPAGPSSARSTRTSSIHVNSPAPRLELSKPRASTTEGLVDRVTALNIGFHQAGFLGAPELRKSRSRSPSVHRPIHEIGSEDEPEELSHMRQMQDATSNITSMMSRMTNILASSNLHRENQSSIQGLHQKAIRLQNLGLPSSWVVGLVGDSGVGKSSLIDCLLDQKDLTRSSGNGAACTCAVTEYHFREKGDFIIHVDYFTLEDLEKQFKNLLTAYRDYELLPEDAKARAAQDQDSSLVGMQLKADVAAKTFRASFQEKLEQTPTILSSMPLKDAVSTMIKWASDVLPRQGVEESFDKIEACSARIKELVSESDGPSPNRMPRIYWPFIRKVRVYLYAHILSKGLIIADLPGLRDLNSARRVITERYVRECDQIFVVAPIARAVTDKSPHEVYDLASGTTMSKVDIICTRSEEVNFEEARHDWPAEKSVIEEMLKAIVTATREIESLEAEIVTLKEGCEDSTQEKQQQSSSLLNEVWDIRRFKERHERSLQCLIIRLRNDKVNNGLRVEYRNHPLSKTLRVFCVSKVIYWNHRSHPVEAALPWLQLSGILELRRYCMGIVAQSRLRATEEFIKDEIPAFLTSVELWVKAGAGNASADSKRRALDAVSDIQRETNEVTSPVSELHTIWHTLYTEFKRQINLRMEQSSPQWTARAKQKSLSWEDFPAQSYKAFCSNYGDHKTKRIGRRRWNREAMEGMRIDMPEVWSTFAADLSQKLVEINNSIDDSFKTVLEVALSAAAAQPRTEDNTSSAIRSIATILQHRKALTYHGIEDAITLFFSQLSSLKTDTLTSTQTTFIGMLMEDTYTAANMDFGRGSDRRRKDLITDKFGSESLFYDHRHEAKKGFKKIARNLEENVKTIVQKQIEFIEVDLQMMRDENVILDSERNPEFRIRVRTEMEWAKEEIDRISRKFRGIS